jgi:hypothetical protein
MPAMMDAGKRIQTCAAMVLVGLLAAAPARANVSKAWAAAKANLPATTGFVVAIDVARIARTPSFTRFYNAARSDERDLEEIDSALRDHCKLELPEAIEGLVVAGNLANKGKDLVMYFQLAVDRKKASACLASLLAMKANRKTSVAQQGIYTIGRSRGDRIYFAWVAPRVVAMSVDPENKKWLDAWIGKRGFARSPVAKLAGKLDTSGIAFGAFSNGGKPLDAWVPVVAGHGGVGLKRGTLSGSATFVTADSKTATSMVGELEQELGRAMKKKRTPPVVKRVLSGVTVTGRGNGFTIRGTAKERDFADALASLMFRNRATPRASVPPPVERK